jgi:hypothetical protein
MAVSQPVSVYPETMSEPNVQTNIEDEVKVLSELQLPAKEKK